MKKIFLHIFLLLSISLTSHAEVIFSEFDYNKMTFDKNWKTFFTDSKEDIKREFIFSKNGFGILNVYNENGVLQASINIENSKPLGLTKNYYPNGKIQEEYFVNEKFQFIGSYKHYYKNGKIERELTYVNDFIVGTYTLFFETGIVKEIGIGIVINGETQSNDGELKEFYESGNLHFSTFFSKGMKNGKAFEYFDNKRKKIKASAFFINDKLNNKAISYDSYGNKLSVENYTNGVLDGLFTKYFSNKSISEESKWNNGIPIYVLTFHKNGKVKSEKLFKKGLINGVYTEFFSDGSLKIKQHYLNGKREGLVFQNFESGKLKLKVSFLNDKLNGEYIEYYKNGKLKVKEKYISGIASGKQVYYFENGNKNKVKSMVNGILNGICYWYYKNGKLKQETLYKNGKPVSGFNYSINGEKNKITKWVD